MTKYFNEEKWKEAIKHNDWYLRLSSDYKRLIELASKSEKDISNDIKEEIYNFFESNFASCKISLGKAGPNWDAGRKPIDTIIIHHTSNKSGISWQRLNVIHLVRLYAVYYSNPAENEKHITGEAIYSNHFREGQQVFYAYHWFVRENGEVERLLKDNEIGWQAGDWETNCRSVAICLDGDFEDSIPSEKFILGIVKIIKENYAFVKKERILGHREVNKNKTCPGNLFLTDWKKKILNLL